MRLCLILQPSRRFTYVTAHSTALPLLHLRHRHFTYITAHSPSLPRFTYIMAHSTTLPLLHLRHRHFTYFTWRAANAQGDEKQSVVHQLVTAPPRSPTLASLHLRHTFSNSSAASSTPHPILQPFRRFTYVTGHSTTLPLLHLRHRHFTYFTWRAAHAQRDKKNSRGGLICYSKLLSLEVATVLDSC